MSNFKKIAELQPETRTNLKQYFTELYGPDYANAMVQDYTTSAKDVVEPKKESK